MEHLQVNFWVKDAEPLSTSIYFKIILSCSIRRWRDKGKLPSFRVKLIDE